MSVALRKRLFSSDEYHSMLDTGILSPEDRVELIEGEVLEMAAISSRHAACVKRLNRVFTQGLLGRALVGVQDPVHLSPFSEPEPDLSVLRPRDDLYAGAHPTPEDIFLVVEVAHASLDYDRSVKVPLYARSGIREVWLFDLSRPVVGVYRQPGVGGYTKVELLGRGDRVAPEAFPDLVLDLDWLFG
jgi:Uma2 family endonuclease